MFHKKRKSLIVSAGMDKKLYAVASQGQALESRVSDQAARAPCFLIFDASGNLLEKLANPVSDASRGAAPRAVDLLASRRITLLVAARFGKRIIRELAQAGIGHKQSSGQVCHVMQQILNPKE
jgi:predicted Fe-Mo cluster-binding NifX family protein